LTQLEQAGLKLGVTGKTAVGVYARKQLEAAELKQKAAV
jgi:hypothetical protein